MTQSDARVLSAKPRVASGADEGYDSDVTRDDASRKPHAPSKVAASPPPVATAQPATRRSARTQKADALDITAKLSNLQTAEPAAAGKKKRGAAPETQLESQGELSRRSCSADRCV